MKRKQCNKEADRIELLNMLHELDCRAEERFHEKEEKRLKMFLDAEEERRKKQHEEEKEMRMLEQQHEERMQRMFMGFMQQIMAMLAAPPAATYQVPTPSTPRSQTQPLFPPSPGQFQSQPDEPYF